MSAVHYRSSRPSSGSAPAVYTRHTKERDRFRLLMLMMPLQTFLSVKVTWIRLRDWHILTSGLLTYTADARFRVKHAPESSEWTLEIKFLQKRDEGAYYCQVRARLFSKKPLVTLLEPTLGDETSHANREAISAALYV